MESQYFKRICDFLKSHSSTEKAVLTSKRNSLVLFLTEPTIMTELCECTTFVKNENENNLRFCHFPVWYYADVSDAQ